jgi:hypothetical protein
MFDSIVRAVSEHKSIVITAAAVALIAGIVSPLGQAVAQPNFPISIDAGRASIFIDEYRISVDVDDIVNLDIFRPDTAFGDGLLT